ncbi:MAG TPA: polyprenyl synthetase family protein [Spirochaetota bacterium]|nr:polyprenyl synthetase family protein [Spirochaetota bacterium]
MGEDTIERMLDSRKEIIKNYLKEFLFGKKQQLGTVNRWGDDLPERLYRFCAGGKLLRGSLILLSVDILLSGGERLHTAVASAYELIHSSLLIHDDIMDRDETRRGMPSIFYQYKEIAEKGGPKEQYHTGESLGLCAGDVALFLAFELLTLADTDPARKLKILSLWSRELQGVGIAQMQDVYFSTLKKGVLENDIMTLYRYKTARYTFSIPFATGAILAGRDEKTVNDLLILGERYGLIYQLIDDRIGLFGDSVTTGKPVGTDLEEKKKTLLLYYLGQLASQDQKRKLNDIMKKDRITPEDLEYIREAAVSCGAAGRIEQRLEELKKEARAMIASIPVSEGYKNVLDGLLDYGLKRKS